MDLLRRLSDSLTCYLAGRDRPFTSAPAKWREPCPRCHGTNTMVRLIGPTRIVKCLDKMMNWDIITKSTGCKHRYIAYDGMGAHATNWYACAHPASTGSPCASWVCPISREHQPCESAQGIKSLLNEAKVIAEVHPSKDARAFAHQVIYWLSPMCNEKQWIEASSVAFDGTMYWARVSKSDHPGKPDDMLKIMAQARADTIAS